VTDAVPKEIKEWRSRPRKPLFPIPFLEAQSLVIFHQRLSRAAIQIG